MLVIEEFPFTISIAEIVSKIKIDKIFSVVYVCILKGINISQSADFAPYNTVRKQLNIDTRWILKANKVVIPNQLETEVKKTFHNEHMGINKVKSRALCYVSWSLINNDIETLNKSCESCQRNKN